MEEAWAWEADRKMSVIARESGSRYLLGRAGGGEE